MRSATALGCYVVLWFSVWKMGTMILRILAFNVPVGMNTVDRILSKHYFPNIFTLNLTCPGVQLDLKYY